MDIYFVRISHEEVYTMTHITKNKIDEWYDKNTDISLYLDDDWIDAEFYLIASNVTESNVEKFGYAFDDAFVGNFITDYKQYTRDICRYPWVENKMVFNNQDIYEEEVLPELEQLKYRADNLLGKLVLAQSLKDDGINDIFV